MFLIAKLEVEEAKRKQEEEEFRLREELRIYEEQKRKWRTEVIMGISSQGNCHSSVGN